MRGVLQTVIAGRHIASRQGQERPREVLAKPFSVAVLQIKEDTSFK